MTTLLSSSRTLLLIGVDAVGGFTNGAFKVLSRSAFHAASRGAEGGAAALGVFDGGMKLVNVVGYLHELGRGKVAKVAHDGFKDRHGGQSRFCGVSGQGFTRCGKSCLVNLIRQHDVGVNLPTRLGASLTQRSENRW